MSETSVETLAVKQAITEVLYRYCRGIDRLDREMARSVWHADGTADYGDMFVGTGYEFVEWVLGSQDDTGVAATHFHQVANVLIDILPDGDHAVSESYVTAAVRAKPHDGIT